MRREEQRLAYLPAILVFTDTFGYAIVLPLLPLAAAHRGAGPLAIGALFATYSLLQLVCAPWLGHLSDRYGRKPVLLGSLAGSAAGFALMLAPGYPLLLLSRVIDGATAGNISIANSIILDRFPRRDWGRRFTVMSSATGAGIVAGVSVSAALAPFGLAGAAITAIGLCGVSATVLWVLLPETSRRDGAPRRPRVPVPRIQLAFPSGLVATTLQSAFLLTLPLFLFRVLGWRETQSTVAIAVLIAVAAAVQIVAVGRLLRRVGPRSGAIAGFVLLAMSGLGLALASTPVTVLAAATIAVLGVALLSPAVPTLIGVQNDQLAEGELMGVNQSIASAGQMAGPLLGYGALIFSPAGYGAVCTVLAAGGLALTYPIRARR
jgi:MFS family permease